MIYDMIYKQGQAFGVCFKQPSWLVQSPSLFELPGGERKSWWCLTRKFAKSALGQSKRTCSSSCTQCQLHLVQILSS